MAQTKEGEYLNLLQGVSQQNRSMRLEGQLSEQTNMLSDVITHLRRRPAFPFYELIEFKGATSDNMTSIFIDRGAQGRHLLINTTTGEWQLRDQNTFEQISGGTDEYFICKDTASLSMCALSTDVYINNAEQQLSVERNPDAQDPSTTGFAFVKSGNYATSYTLTVQSGGLSKTVEYRTPNGTGGDDANKTTPSYIAEQLYNKLKPAETPPSNGTSSQDDPPAEPEFKIFRKDQYLFFQGKDINISTSTSNALFTVSRFHVVNTITDLPAMLPDEADKSLISVGTSSDALVWYIYVKATSSWLETAAWGSITAIKNTPRCLEVDDTMTTPVFEGRQAGDDDNNDDPAFVKYERITGLGSFQGRLVLLCGAFVSMSDSGNPLRFYRKTVTQILPSDRIDIGAGSTQNTVFRSCIQFNRDLLIFGDSVQALVVGAGAAITSQTAAITLTSEYTCESKYTPVNIGNTVLYPFKRSTSYIGLWELIPSSYTSSQYESLDATSQVPEYIEGNIRHLISSSSVNMCICSASKNPRSLYIYEYRWGQQAEKIQSAWHEWIMPLPVVMTHFAREKLFIFMGSNSDPDQLACTTVDLREGYNPNFDMNLPYADLWAKVNVKDETFVVPDKIVKLGLPEDKYVLAPTQGTYQGGIVGVEQVKGSAGTAVAGVPDGEYYLGTRYTSSFTPTPPFIKDDNDKSIGIGTVRLVEMQAIVNETGEFMVHAVDDRTGLDYTMKCSGAILDSKELSPDYPILGMNNFVYIPCRSNADTTFVKFYTDTTQDLNVVSLQYKLRFNFSRGRV